jgi:hypothetical protein
MRRLCVVGVPVWDTFITKILNIFSFCEKMAHSANILKTKKAIKKITKKINGNLKERAYFLWDSNPLLS